MDVRDIEVFARVFEAGSLTRAAQVLCVSRQALSKSLSHLEAQVGQLFERRPRGVAPTALAQAVYPHACRVLGEMAEIARQSDNFACGRAGVLRLAVEANAALTVPPSLFEAYAAARPDLAFSVSLLPSAAAREALFTGAADAVLAGPFCGAGCEPVSCDACGAPGCSGPHPGLVYEPIASSSLVIVFDNGVFAGAAAGLLLPGGDGCAAWTASLSALAEKRIFGIDPANSVERRLRPYLARRVPSARLEYGLSDAAFVASQMRSGQGGIIVEASGARQDYGSARYVHVPLTGDDAPVWEVGVTCRLDTPAVPIVRDLVDFARSMPTASL